MKIAGFTFIRNAVQNDYPIVEAIEAFLKDLLIQEGFADGSLIVHLTQHPVPNAEVG